MLSSSNLHSNPEKHGLVSSLLPRRGKGGSETLCSLPTVTQHMGQGPIDSDSDLGFSDSETRSAKWLGDPPSEGSFLRVWAEDRIM